MTLKLRAKVNFPATVTATDGLQVVKQNGIWTVSPKWDDLTLETVIPDPEARELWTRDPSTATYYRLSVQALIDSAKGADGSPIVILASGQSNFSNVNDLDWTPAPNVKLWNFDGNGSPVVGTQFDDIDPTKISVPWRLASTIAEANPTREVYVLNISISGQSIVQWLPGASAPDMYDMISDNVVAALAVLGLSSIDVFAWWQGEIDRASPSTYRANFAAVMARLKAETWFPASTPVLIYGIGSTAVSGQAGQDEINGVLQACAGDAVDTTTFLYTASIPAAYWSAQHVTANGQFVAGTLGAYAILGSARRAVLTGVVNDPVNGVLVKGHTSPIPLNPIGLLSGFQFHSTEILKSGIAAVQWSNEGSCASVSLRKSRGATVGAHAAVASGDFLGQFLLGGDDGTQFVNSAAIRAIVDAAVSAGVIPTGLQFLVMNTAGTLQEVLRIDDDGRVGIGTTTPSFKLDVIGNLQIAPAASVTPVNIGSVVFQSTSNTQLTIKMKGSDGVVRKVDLTLA